MPCQINSFMEKAVEMSFRFLHEVMLVFKPQNHARNRTSITAKYPVTARFDNFRINAAEKIIEEEI